MSKVCVIGQWHLGAVTSACLAELGHEVIGVEENPALAQKLNQGIPPIFEPGLEALFQSNLAKGTLRFSSERVEAVIPADFVFISFDTPLNENDELDLTPILDTVEKIEPHLNQNKILIIQSQIPVGTCEKLGFPRIVYLPENLRLGQAIARFMKPAMMVMGSEDRSALDQVDVLFSKIESPRIRTNLKTAEMIKHALNVFFSTCISYANEIGNLCDEIGADGKKVAEALRLDERIGPKALVEPGAPFGGGTLARDLKILQSLGKSVNYETWLIDSVLSVNERQKQLAVTRLRDYYGDLRGLQIGVLGLTYKAGTSTLRRSTAIDLIEQLQGDGVKIKAFDPKANPEETASLKYISLEGDAYRTAEGSQALVIATEWPEFKDLDFLKIKSLMKNPVILDMKNLLNPESLTSLGFHYFGMGRGYKPDPVNLEKAL